MRNDMETICLSLDPQVLMFAYNQLCKSLRSKRVSLSREIFRSEGEMVIYFVFAKKKSSEIS
jgi:hypothetical protein